MLPNFFPSTIYETKEYRIFRDGEEMPLNWSLSTSSKLLLQTQDFRSRTGSFALDFVLKMCFSFSKLSFNSHSHWDVAEWFQPKESLSGADEALNLSCALYSFCELWLENHNLSFAFAVLVMKRLGVSPCGSTRSFLSFVLCIKRRQESEILWMTQYGTETWASAGATSTFCSSFSSCRWCNVNGRSQNALLLLHHRMPMFR